MGCLVEPHRRDTCSLDREFKPSAGSRDILDRKCYRKTSVSATTTPGEPHNEPQCLSPWNYKLYRSIWPTKKWYDNAPRRAILLIQRILERTSNENISRTRSSIKLKYPILYQEHMTIEEKARHCHKSSTSPLIQKFYRKNFKEEDIETINVYLAEISDFVPGAYDN